jgi:hypothetical protein
MWCGVVWCGVVGLVWRVLRGVLLAMLLLTIAGLVFFLGFLCAACRYYDREGRSLQVVGCKHMTLHERIVSLEPELRKMVRLNLFFVFLFY